MAFDLAKGNMNINTCHLEVFQQNYPISVNGKAVLGGYRFLFYFYPHFQKQLL
jgi:hypothetical protein